MSMLFPTVALSLLHTCSKLGYGLAIGGEDSTDFRDEYPNLTSSNYLGAFESSSKQKIVAGIPAITKNPELRDSRNESTIWNDLEEPGIPGWERNVSRNTLDYVDPSRDTTLIDGRKICNNSTRMVIFVHSAPKDSSIRRVIRRTWASDHPKNIAVVFFSGWVEDASVQEALLVESAEHGDIVQDDFHDSYNNLTLKSIFELKWFIFSCPRGDFLMKTDTDTFVSIRRLVDVVSNIDRKEGILLGHVYRKGSPYRDPESKWYTPRYFHSEDVYPDYLAGTAYLMSRDVVQKLFAAALVTPLLHSIDDVFVTGICARSARVTPKKLIGILVSDCPPSSNKFISCHHASPDMLVTLWDAEVLALGVEKSSAESTNDPRRNNTRLVAHARTSSARTIQYSLPLQFTIVAVITIHDGDLLSNFVIDRFRDLAKCY